MWQRTTSIREPVGQKVALTADEQLQQLPITFQAARAYRNILRVGGWNGLYHHFIFASEPWYVMSVVHMWGQLHEGKMSLYQGRQFIAPNLSEEEKREGNGKLQYSGCICSTNHFVGQIRFASHDSSYSELQVTFHWTLIYFKEHLQNTTSGIHCHSRNMLALD